MATYLRPINGSIAGLVALSGTAAFVMKTEGFRINLAQEDHDVSGFGDGGNSYYSPGRNRWGGAANGFALSGATTAIGMGWLTGTNSLLVTGTFQADNGHTYTGSCRVSVIAINANYKQGGFAPLAITFVGEGPLTEA